MSPYCTRLAAILLGSFTAILPVSALFTAALSVGTLSAGDAKTEAAATLATLTPEEQAAGFRLIFDGQSLKGWKHGGNWSVEQGAVGCPTRGGDLTYTAEPVPDDFELRFDWKIAKGGNSGVYYRPGQYEYQLLDDEFSPYGENPRQAAGSLFFCMAPSQRVVKPHEEWNTSRIVCQGTVIQHWLNEVKVIDFDYTDPRWANEVRILKIRGANLAARGAQLRLQDHGQTTWFRNLRWRPIPASEQLERTELTPLPIPAGALQKENARIEQMLKSRAGKTQQP